jgi:hypothetical protein
MILIWRGWYSSRADKIQLKQMILIWRGRYSSGAEDIHPMETIFIQERRISSMMVDSWNYNQPLEMIFNLWGSYSTTRDHNQPLGMIIGWQRWYIVCSRWIYHHHVSKNSSRSQLSAKEDIKHPFLGVGLHMYSIQLSIIWFSKYIKCHQLCKNESLVFNALHKTDSKQFNISVEFFNHIYRFSEKTAKVKVFVWFSVSLLW